MTEKKQLLAEDPDLLALRVSELHDELRQINPATLASNTGTTYLPAGLDQGTFYFQFWGREISLTYPEFVARDERTGEMLGTMSRAMLAYYFTLSDGTPKSDNWISYSELPDGKFYAQAFQGYSGNEMAKTFGNDKNGFARTATSLGGCQLGQAGSIGDVAFAFRVLPMVSLLVVCWLGDEDFPTSYRVLFDSAVSHHLSTDACAILGSTLTRRMIKSYERLESH